MLSLLASLAHSGFRETIRTILHYENTIEKRPSQPRKSYARIRTRPQKGKDRKTPAQTYQLIGMRDGESTYRLVDVGTSRRKSGTEEIIVVRKKEMETQKGEEEVGRKREGRERDGERGKKDGRRMKRRRKGADSTGLTSEIGLLVTSPTQRNSFPVHRSTRPPRNDIATYTSNRPNPVTSLSSQPNTPTRQPPITLSALRSQRQLRQRTDSAMPTPTTNNFNPQTHSRAAPHNVMRNSHPTALTSPSPTPHPRPTSSRSPFSQPGMSARHSEEFVFGGVNGAVIGFDDDRNGDEDETGEDGSRGPGTEIETVLLAEMSTGVGEREGEGLRGRQMGEKGGQRHGAF